MPRPSRSVRLVLAGLLSTALAFGVSTTGAQAVSLTSSVNRAAPTAACTNAQAQDASAASIVEKKTKKFKKAKRAFKRAKRVFNRQPTVQHRKELRQAKAAKNKAKRKLRAAQERRQQTATNVAIFCATPDGTPTPAPTPVSPIQPLCEAIPELQPLCDATSAGSTSPLQPLCDAIPELAGLCAVTPGSLSDPAALEALLNQLNFAGLPADTLLAIVANIVVDIASGDFAGVADQLGMTPEALENLLRAIGIPIP